MFIVIDWILLLTAVYLIIFNTEMWGTLLGFSLFMINFLILEWVEDGPGQRLKPSKNEWIFLGLWLASYLILNAVWSDAHLAAPYFNTALFLYFGYRVYRTINQMK